MNVHPVEPALCSSFSSSSVPPSSITRPGKGFANSSQNKQQHPCTEHRFTVKTYPGVSVHVQVCDLPDAEGPLSAEGLHQWQTRLMANHPASQDSHLDSSFSLQREAERNTQLKASLMGDRRVVITPCVLPPSRKVLQRWIRAKDLYTQLKQQKNKGLGLGDKCTESNEAESKTPRHQEQPHEKITPSVIQSKVAIHKGKGKSGRFGKVKNPHYSSIKVSPKTDVITEEVHEGVAKEESSSVLVDDESLSRASPRRSLDDSAIALDISFEFKTPKRRFQRSFSADSNVERTQAEDELTSVPPTELSGSSPQVVFRKDEYSTPHRKRRKSMEDLKVLQHSTPTMLSSTPSNRRVSFMESETPTCTPISKARSGDTPAGPHRTGSVRASAPSATPSTSLGDTAPSPVTPTSWKALEKRRPVRRISSGTQALVQRMLLSSQLKVNLTRLVTGNIGNAGEVIPKTKVCYRFSPI